MSHQVDFHAMGSRIRLIVDSDEPPAALAELPARFEQWEQVLSRFRNDSELCQLNRAAGSIVAVSSTLWDVFHASFQAEQRTGGLVNPLILAALIQAGYDRDFGLMPADGLPAGATVSLQQPVPPLSTVEIDASQQTLCLPFGSQLDFGGIAKGWAAQQAMLALRSYGPALVSAGGDIAVSGPRAHGEPWQIGVDDPFTPGAYAEMLYLDGGAVATSGRDYRRWIRSGVAQHHVIDPRTQQPAQTDVLTATVVAADAVTAEACAKAVMILGSQAGLEWLDKDDTLAAFLVLEDGRRLYSRHLEHYL